MSSAVLAQNYDEEYIKYQLMSQQETNKKVEKFGKIYFCNDKPQFFIIEKDGYANNTYAWACRIDWDNNGNGRGIATISDRNEILGERQNALGSSLTLCELGGHKRQEELCSFLSKKFTGKRTADAKQAGLDKYLVVEGYQQVIAPPPGAKQKKYLVMQAGSRLGSIGARYEVILIDEKDIFSHFLKGTIHHTWVYPTSCVTLPNVNDNDEIKAVIDELQAVASSDDKAKVYVYLFGFADKKEKGAQSEKDDNLIISRARTLGWRQHIEGSLHDSRVEIKECWFGHELHNELLSNTVKKEDSPDKAEENPYSESAAGGTKITYPETNLNRRVEIFISTTENPSAVRGWINLWNQLRSADKNPLHIPQKIWKTYTETRNVIKDEQNLPGKTRAIEDVLVKEKNMALP